MCSSACSEYILPTRKSVEVTKDTLIGFHGNSLLREKLLLERGVDIPEHCGWSGRDWLNYIYSNKGISRNFLNEQADRLRVLDFEYFYSSGGCLNTKVTYEHLFWFPTAEQIKEYLNVEIVGQLCADNPSCVNKVSKRNIRGGTCVFGDRIRNC